MSAHGAMIILQANLPIADPSEFKKWGRRAWRRNGAEKPCSNNALESRERLAQKANVFPRHWNRFGIAVNTPNDSIEYLETSGTENTAAV